MSGFRVRAVDGQPGAFPRSQSREIRIARDHPLWWPIWAANWTGQFFATPAVWLALRGTQS